MPFHYDPNGFYITYTVCCVVKVFFLQPNCFYIAGFQFFKSHTHFFWHFRNKELGFLAIFSMLFSLLAKKNDFQGNLSANGEVVNNITHN